MRTRLRLSQSQEEQRLPPAHDHHHSSAHHAARHGEPTSAESYDAPGKKLSPAAILRLQRTYGNAALQRMLADHTSDRGCNCAACRVSTKSAVQREAVQRCAACGGDEEHAVQRWPWDDDEDEGESAESSGEGGGGGASSYQPEPESNTDDGSGTSYGGQQEKQESEADDSGTDSDSGSESETEGGWWPFDNDDDQEDEAESDDDSRSEPEDEDDDDSDWWPFDDDDEDESDEDDDSDDDNEDEDEDEDEADEDEEQEGQEHPASGSGGGAGPYGGGGMAGCDVAPGTPSTGKTRKLKINPNVSVEANVEEDPDAVHDPNTWAYDPIDASGVGVNVTVTPGAYSGRAWGGTTPFFTTDAPTWAENDPADTVTVNTTINANIKWGTSTSGIDNPIDIVSAKDPQLNKMNYLSVANDFDAKAGGPVMSQFWSSPLTVKHELYHVEHIKRLINEWLPSFKFNLGRAEVDVPWTWWSDDDKKKATMQVTNAVDAQLKSYSQSVYSAFSSNGEQLAYASQAGSYRSLAKGIRDYAAEQGWDK